MEHLGVGGGQIPRDCFERPGCREKRHCNNFPGADDGEVWFFRSPHSPTLSRAVQRTNLVRRPSIGEQQLKAALSSVRCSLTLVRSARHTNLRAVFCTCAAAKKRVMPHQSKLPCFASRIAAFCCNSFLQLNIASFKKRKYALCVPPFAHACPQCTAHESACCFFAPVPRRKKELCRTSLTPPASSQSWLHFSVPYRFPCPVKRASPRATHTKKGRPCRPKTSKKIRGRISSVADGRGWISYYLPSAALRPAI